MGRLHRGRFVDVVAFDVLPAEVVGEDENDVGFVGSFGEGVVGLDLEEGEEESAREEAGEEFVHAEVVKGRDYSSIEQVSAERLMRILKLLSKRRSR